MLPEGTYRGVIDRFEEDADGTELAVILLEEDGEVVEQIDMPRAELPFEVGQDTVLEMTFVDGELTDVEDTLEETKSRAEAAQERFDQLAKRPPDDSEFDTDENPKE